MNAFVKVLQNLKATAGTSFTKPWARLSFYPNTALGSNILLAVGCVNMRCNHCVLLPAAGRRMQFCHLIFTQPMESNIFGSSMMVRLCEFEGLLHVYRNHASWSNCSTHPQFFHVNNILLHGCNPVGRFAHADDAAADPRSDVARLERGLHRPLELRLGVDGRHPASEGDCQKPS